MKELFSRPGAKHTEVICPASAMVYRLGSLFKKAFYNKKYFLSVVLTTFIFLGLGTAVYAEIDSMLDNITNLIRIFSKTAESQEQTREIIGRLNRLSSQNQEVVADNNEIPEI